MQIKIAGIDWKVVEKQDLKDSEDAKVHGLCDHIAKVISLEANNAPNLKLETYLHELVHATLDEYFQTYKFRDEEQCCDVISRGLCSGLLPLIPEFKLKE